MSDPVKNTKLYWLVFASLLVATFLTVAQARMITLDHTVNKVIGLIIACSKGTLVVLFFMHLKYEKKYFYTVVLFPLSLVLVIIFANIPDVANGGMWGHTTQGVELHGTEASGGGHE
jgi:cytochrome c oxidase subunit 4